MASFYERVVMPRLIAAGMKNKAMTKYRPRIPALARGRVLEIGIGPALNIPHYTDAVERLFGLEPSAHLREVAAAEAARARFPVELLDAGAEAIPLESRSVDCVVSTWTLCSIAGLPQALSEIRRVLKPGGELLFLEHGRAPEASVARWQDRLAPVFRGLAGCNPNLPMDRLIEDAGFRFSEIERSYFDGPKFISWHFIGRASPA
jgi:ubiquinone/menaquinone biosynthesis C-methylase UbiE